MLMDILCTGLEAKNSQSAIEILMNNPTLLENLRKAHQGNYGIILSLLGCLDHGMETKRLVDRIIDASEFSSFSSLFELHIGALCAQRDLMCEKTHADFWFMNSGPCDAPARRYPR